MGGIGNGSCGGVPGLVCSAKVAVWANCPLKQGETWKAGERPVVVCERPPKQGVARGVEKAMMRIAPYSGKAK